MDYRETVEDYTKMVDGKLKPYLENLVYEAEKYHPVIRDIYKSVLEYVLRSGKRIASCSMLLTYEGYTGKVDDRILDVAVAVELYRHAILIHDDLADMDELRRGGKSIHKIFVEKRGERFGFSAALFTGNSLSSQALKTIWKTDFDHRLLEKASNLLVDDCCSVNESQILDLYFEYSEPTVDEWRKMASRRAASLFRATMGVGAILGGASEEELKLVKKAATSIGYAFDIQDDIIGSFASEKEYGRPPKGDILLAKKPLHMVYTYQLAEKSKLERLREIFRTRDFDDEKVEYVREVVRSSGGLEKAKEESVKYAEEAIMFLEKTTMSSGVKSLLASLMRFVIGSLNWYG